MNSISLEKKESIKMMGKCKRKKNRKITFGTSFSHLHQRVREARIVRRVLERPSFHFFLSSGFYHFSSPFIHFSLPSFLCFSFFFFFFPLLSVFVSSEPSVFFIYFVSMYLVSSEDLPAPPRVLQKKGRGARREERNVNVMRDHARHHVVSATRPRRLLANFYYSRINVREWITEHGANIVGVLEPAITGLTARPRLVCTVHFRQPSGGPRGPVSEYI